MLENSEKVKDYVSSRLLDLKKLFGYLCACFGV